MDKRTWVAIAILLAFAMSLTSWRALARAGEAPKGTPTSEAESAQNLAPPELKALPGKFTLTKSAEPQRVKLTGTGFEDGLSVRMETPGGDYIITFGPNALTSVTGETIELTTEFTEPGTYLFYVVNPDRQRSNAITLKVR